MFICAFTFTEHNEILFWRGANLCIKSVILVQSYGVNWSEEVEGMGEGHLLTSGVFQCMPPRTSIAEHWALGDISII